MEDRNKPGAEEYTFKVLTDQEKDDILVNFLKAQEMDLFCHMINRQRYEEILKSYTDNDEWRAKIEHDLETTKQRIKEVKSIIDATTQQLPPQDRLQQAIERINLAK